MKIKQSIDNIKYVFSETKYILISLISSLVFGLIMFYFTNYDLIAGNMGLIYANIQIFLQIMFVLFFGINISLLFYQIKAAADHKSSGVGSTTLGSILGIIVSGCPSCGITLASYIGLSSFLSSFPFYGIEIKIIGLIILIYSTYSISKNIGQCKISV